MTDLERKLINENVILENLRNALTELNNNIQILEYRKERLMDGIYYTRRTILQLENESKQEKDS